MGPEEFVPFALVTTRLACVALAILAGVAIYKADRDEEDKSPATAMMGGLLALGGAIVWISFGGKITDTERTIMYLALASLLWGLRKYVAVRSECNETRRKARLGDCPHTHRRQEPGVGG